LNFQCRGPLAIGFDLTASTAVQEFRIVGSTATTSSSTVKRLVRESVGVGAAASLRTANIWVALFHRASSIGSWVEFAVVVAIGVVGNWYARDEEGEQVVHEDALDAACADGAVVARVRFGARAEAVATGTGTGLILLLPRYALFVLILGVDHGALVAVGQRLTKSVDFVHWRSLAPSHVVVKVAPAAVLVQLLDG